MQALTIPLPDKLIQLSDIPALSPVQRDRFSFHLAVIKITRLLSGSVAVTIPASTPANPDPKPSAAILWLPPHKRPSLLPLLFSGLLYIVIFRFGVTATWHLYTFERDLEALSASLLSPLGYKKDDCGFVLLIGTDPQFKGKGYAAQLLQWQIKRHREGFPGVPVVLDTTTDQAQKVYEKIGFRYLGKRRVETGTDSDGIKLAKGAIAPEEVFEQRVLILEE